MRTFKIRRSYNPESGKACHDVEGMDGLTEEEAMRHCQDPESREAGEWFDLYVAE